MVEKVQMLQTVDYNHYNRQLNPYLYRRIVRLFYKVQEQNNEEKTEVKNNNTFRLFQFLIINGQGMKENKRRFAQCIEDSQLTTDEFYDPFSNQSYNLIQQKNSKVNYSELKCSVTLFQDEQEENNNPIHPSQFQQQVELNVMKPINLNNGLSKNQGQFGKLHSNPNKSNILEKIISNKNKVRKTNQEIPSKIFQQQLFDFNTSFRVAYPQTPGFKNLLHSPFKKFNSQFKDVIFTLSTPDQPMESRGNFNQIVQLNANPLTYYNKTKLSFQSAKFMIGIALKMKELNHINQCLYFCCLACYCEPYNYQVWKKYINMLQEQGKLAKACAVAKTGFLFTQNEELAKSYLINGEKSGLDIRKVQGIMCSISSPEAFQKSLLPQSAKLQIKYGNTWKGIKILWQICKSNQYKLSVCMITLFLARYLQNIGYPEKALTILRRSFSKSMSKLQIYLLYLQISMRVNKCMIESDLQEVLKYVDYISGENRYRLYLQLAQILYKNNDERYYTLLSNAYKAAIQFCAPGAGCSKALKQIYYATVKFVGAMPVSKRIMSDSTIFQENRRRFITGSPLIQYQFQDWKFYLHYGVIKKHELLSHASKKWPLTGRIIAEWIHCLRANHEPLQMLKIWRDKIDQVPKSGELWCEGGRIYADLQEYSNAQKCFRCAMHFTPQYGDSFIQQLKLLLRDSRFLQIQNLKKLFLVSEPFYGHVLSYLKLNHWQSYPLTLNQVWNGAVYEISNQIYKQKGNTKCFTAYQPYNIAYKGQSTEKERQKLFISYEQMENRC